MSMEQGYGPYGIRKPRALVVPGLSWETKNRNKNSLPVRCFVFAEGPFCFCMNANNNTYSCLRTINATHNFLYCEFVTGLVTYYNMKSDPFQQWNRAHTLEPRERDWLRHTLSEMVRCRGSAQCAVSPAKRRKKLDAFNAVQPPPPSVGKF